MRDIALFINGVYDIILREISQVHSNQPDLPLYLQPYSGSKIQKLSKDPPTPEDSMRILLSLTNDLQNVHYVGEIIGWADKRELNKHEWQDIDRIIKTYQKEEGGLYPGPDESQSFAVNLLTVRRLRALKKPFAVDQLIKDSDKLPLSMSRTRSGG